jgi:hypothetical protein
MRGKVTENRARADSEGRATVGSEGLEAAAGYS